MKRLIDLVVSLTLLILLLPVMCIVALLIRCTMGGSVIFKQKRPGLHGKLFTLYKFRTMRHSVNQVGNLQPDEKRLTTVGKLLRKFSLDELPQLINVIKGDMSLVGPRPLLEEYLALYSDEQKLRHNVKPGITGWAQVNGRNAITWDEKFELDIWYVSNQSFRFDVKILLLTLVKVIKREGITQNGHASMEKFNGTKEAI